MLECGRRSRRHSSRRSTSRRQRVSAPPAQDAAPGRLSPLLSQWGSSPWRLAQTSFSSQRRADRSPRNHRQPESRQGGRSSPPEAACARDFPNLESSRGATCPGRRGASQAGSRQIRFSGPEDGIGAPVVPIGGSRAASKIVIPRSSLEERDVSSLYAATGLFPVKNLLAELFRSYKRWISPFLPQACRFSPTCSEYARLAVLEHGPLHGSLRAAWRILRCQPFHPGGVDLP